MGCGYHERDVIQYTVISSSLSVQEAMQPGCIACIYTSSKLSTTTTSCNWSSVEVHNCHCHLIPFHGHASCMAACQTPCCTQILAVFSMYAFCTTQLLTLEVTPVTWITTLSFRVTDLNCLSHNFELFAATPLLWCNWSSHVVHIMMHMTHAINNPMSQRVTMVITIYYYSLLQRFYWLMLG